MASPYHQVHSGRKFLMATAANTSATPSHPSNPRIRFNICSSLPLPAPTFRIDGLGGQEQPERDEAQVIHDVLGVDDALREVVEVLGNREKRHQHASGRPD